MKLDRLKISNFRCFGANPTIIDFNQLTAFIGANSSGKTAAMIALVKLFGTLPSEREILRADFHLPCNQKIDSFEHSELFIEAVFSFPELNDPSLSDASIPSFFKYFVVDEEGGEPYLRIRIDATFDNDGSAEGLIDVAYNFIVAAESEEITESVKKPANKNILSNIRCIYVPALRNPSEQLRNVTGTLLNRLYRNIKWDESTKNILEKHIKKVNQTVQKNADISVINAVLQSQWSTFHDDERYGTTKINVSTSDIESVLKHTEIKFAPTVIPRDYDVSELGDGLRSLFYFSLVNTLLEMETRLLQEIISKATIVDKKLVPPPVLTFIVVEEPENHIAPHLLGKVIINLQNTALLSNAQVVLSSHSASIVKRIDATALRYFRVNENSLAIVKNILLPDKEDEKYKYIKGAIEAYPEIYFARIVILGEGDSEEIVIPYLIEKTQKDADILGITVAPLGGRHVNYFWKLLNDLEIPYITLLDLDKERHGGGWGRIKYALNQLLKLGYDKTEIFTCQDGSELTQSDFEKMHERSIDNKKDLKYWIAKLEKYGIYFSVPLDLDFLLLENFTTAYKDMIDESYGPEIKSIGKIKDIEKIGTSKEYLERMKRDIKATLKEEGGDGHTYSNSQKKLMIWYKYLFLGRGKPSTHLAALPNFSISDINDIPQPLNKIIKKVTDRRV